MRQRTTVTGIRLHRPILNPSRKQEGKLRKQPHSELDQLLNEAFQVREELATRRTAELSGESGTYASPPCFMHELDPSYLGFLSRDETITRMIELISAERALVVSAWRVSRDADDSEMRNAFKDIAVCNARFVAALVHHVARLGASAGVGTRVSTDLQLAKVAVREEIAAIADAQRSVLRALRETAPRLGDDAIRSIITEMIDAHDCNIERCLLLAV